MSLSGSCNWISGFTHDRLTFISRSFAPNSIVVAKRKPRDDVWWPARFLRYEPPPEGSDGRQPRKGGKFVVEWTTGKVESVVKECILTSSQKEYRTCKVSHGLDRESAVLY